MNEGTHGDESYLQNIIALYSDFPNKRWLFVQKKSFDYQFPVRTTFSVHVNIFIIVHVWESMSYHYTTVFGIYAVFYV